MAISVNGRPTARWMSYRRSASRRPRLNRRGSNTNAISNTTSRSCVNIVTMNTKRETVIGVRLTWDERRQVERLAMGQPLGTWARRVLLERISERKGGKEGPVKA
jgi:hypothetical protein